MKKLSICALIAIMFFTAISCNKEYGCGEPDQTMVFKYKNEEYANYLTVIYSEEKKSVVGYPGLSDLPGSWILSSEARCSNGYYINTQVSGAKYHIHDCYTDITVEEYKDIWQATIDKHIDMRDTLTSRIIDRDPYEELYDVKKIGVDKIKEMIESGEFFTYEGVERVK